MSEERIYCGSIPSNYEKILEVIAITRFVSIAININSSNGTHVYPIVITEKGVHNLYIHCKTKEATEL